MPTNNGWLHWYQIPRVVALWGLCHATPIHRNLHMFNFTYVSTLSLVTQAPNLESIQPKPFTGLWPAGHLVSFPGERLLPPCSYSRAVFWGSHPVGLLVSSNALSMSGLGPDSGSLDGEGDLVHKNLTLKSAINLYPRSQ